MISNTKVNRIPACRRPVPEQGPRPGRPTYPEIPDTNRHRILEQELAGEQKSLGSSRPKQHRQPSFTLRNHAPRHSLPSFESHTFSQHQLFCQPFVCFNGFISPFHPHASLSLHSLSHDNRSKPSTRQTPRSNNKQTCEVLDIFPQGQHFDMPLFFPQLFLFDLCPTRKFGPYQPGCDPPSWREVLRGQNLGRRQKAGEGEEREQERARRPGGGELGEREREGRE